MKKNALLMVVAITALLAGVLTQNSWSVLLNNKPSEPLFAFNLEDLSGKRHDISEWKGKILIINFWATWCPPCKKEIPEFVALQNQYSAQGLQFIGVAIDDKEAVKDYLTTIKVNYPILIAEDEGIALVNKLGDISGTVPFTVVVDPDNLILHRHPGNFSKEQIMDIVAPLLAKKQ